MNADKARQRAEAAANIALRYDIPLGEDFHTLPSSTVGRILEAAKATKYRLPRNANGSTGRYYYAKLNRDAGSYSGFA